MAGYETLLVEKRGYIARLILNRPERRNALNAKMLEEIPEALAALGADEAVRVIVMKGAGDQAFCAGRDLKEIPVEKSVAQRRAENRHVVRMLETFQTIGTPVIAQVHGYALAGGSMLVAACDMAIAAEDAVFGITEINVGLAPAIVQVPLIRAVGPKMAFQLLTTGERFDGRAAERMGLVNRAVPLAELEGAVSELAEQIAGKSPIALSVTKETFYNLAELDYRRALKYAHEVMTTMMLFDDAQEGTRAFVEKRAPKWSGR